MQAYCVKCREKQDMKDGGEICHLILKRAVIIRPGCLLGAFLLTQISRKGRIIM